MPLGNDIVDLSDPEAALAAHHERFLTRICGPTEIASIAIAADPTRMLWAHWAAKESAFKALRPVCPRIPFVPRRFIVEFARGNDGGIMHGCVRMADNVFTVAVHCHTDGLHAISSLIPQSSSLVPQSFLVIHGVRRVTASARG